MPTTAMTPQPSTNTNSASSPPDYTNATAANNDVNNDVNDHRATTAANESKITNIKFTNATSFLLTAMMVVGVVLFGVREEGVFGDEFLWMKYQTLLTPSNYVNLIWIPIFLLQGLFIYASTINKTLQTSPLVGYNAALTGRSKQSIIIHYPAICATTLMMIYSHDYGYIFCAFLSSVLCGVILTNVLKVQGELLNDMETQLMNDGSKYDNENINNQMSDEETVATIVYNVKTRALQYFALRLPFELYGGYILALISLYLNTFLDGFDSLPTMVYLIMANVSLVGLLGAGFMLLWKIPGQNFYGVGISLVWYLLGVTTELHEPTQPIYNAFSDGAVLTTQIVAGVASTVLMTLLGVRVMKTMIKHNLLNFGGRLGGDRSVCNSAMDDEGEIATDYVQA